MKVSTKGRYALRMMLDLALQGDEVVRIKDISLRQEISEKYRNVCHNTFLYHLSNAYYD